MKTALTLIGPWCLVIAAPCYAAGTQCSDASAKSVYTASGYDGGAAPRPDMDTVVETAAAFGQPLGENRYSEAAGWRNQFGVTLSVKSDLGTKQDQDSNTVKHTYVADLTLTSLDGTPKFTGLVICEDTSYLIPPP